MCKHICLLLTALALVACGDDHGHSHEHHGDGDHGHEHHGHDHGHEHGNAYDAHSASMKPAVPTASQKAGAHTVKLASHGGTTPGSEAHIDLLVEGSPAPDAVRLWIGDASAKGSLKVKADVSNGVVHVHASAPDPMPKGAAIWVSVQSGEQSEQVSFPLESAAAGHDHDHDHDHDHSH